MGVTSVVPEFRAEEQKAKSCFQKVAIALTAFLVAENLRLMNEFKSYRGGVLVVLARAIFELKYLVGFAVATIAVANHTREQADEAHCQMHAAPSLLAVGEELLKVAAEELQTGADVSVSSLGVSSNSTALLMCVAEKKARLTHGWDLDDLEADVPLLALIGLAIATHLAAFLWTLREAIKEKPMDGTEGDAAFCFFLNRGYNSPVARRARKVTVYLTCFGLALLSVVSFARGTLVQLVQGLFFELYALIHTTQGVFASNEKFADPKVEWAVLKSRVAGHFEWTDLLKSAPDLLQGKFVKHAKEDELREIMEASELLQEKHSAANSNDSSSDKAKGHKALI